MSKCISCKTVLTADNTDDGEICRPGDQQEQVFWNSYAASVMRPASRRFRLAAS